MHIAKNCSFFCWEAKLWFCMDGVILPIIVFFGITGESWLYAMILINGNNTCDLYDASLDAYLELNELV